MQRQSKNRTSRWSVIGALATPIIGEDGSILMFVSLVVVCYRVPPQVRIIDDCRRGSGARGFSVLVLPHLRKKILMMMRMLKSMILL